MAIQTSAPSTRDLIETQLRRIFVEGNLFRSSGLSRAFAVPRGGFHARDLAAEKIWGHIAAPCMARRKSSRRRIVVLLTRSSMPERTVLAPVSMLHRFECRQFARHLPAAIPDQVAHDQADKCRPNPYDPCILFHRCPPRFKERSRNGRPRALRHATATLTLGSIPPSREANKGNGLRNQAACWTGAGRGWVRGGRREVGNSFRT